MEEMFETSKAKLASENASEETDFMVGLIKGAGAGAIPEGPNASPISDKDPHIQKQMLTDSEILGNVFLLILAGHETTANSLHFSLVYLALNINSQRHLQSDLDRIFKGRQICEWDYSRDVPRLFNSMAEAVLNEQLRLIPPVTVIPKCAPITQPDQAITINNKKCVVPAGTYIMILSVAAHRNPQFWPAGPPSDPKHPAHPLSNTDNDLEEFKPERWLQDPQPGCCTVTSPPSDPNLIGKSEPTSLFRPPKGAFIPFSEGPRSCIGRRFAQVEVLAVLAVIFSQYSVELAVDGFASDEEIEAMSTKEREKIWIKAKKVTESALKDKMGSILSLKLRGAKVPLRFVKRGTERFN